MRRKSKFIPTLQKIVIIEKRLGRKSKLIATLQKIIIIQKRLKNIDIKVLLVLILSIFFSLY